jgi:hypothetical protein
MHVEWSCRTLRGRMGHVRGCRCRNFFREKESMSAAKPAASGAAIAALATERFEIRRAEIHVVTDRTLAALMLAQWMCAIVLAIVVSPYAWQGKVQADSMHVWAAFVVGGVLTAPAVALAFARPGSVLTRYVMAVAQMLWSALLIHLTAGRIETHFHAFASLAVLSMYRERKVLFTATVVLVADHLLRGILWPESVFGILHPPWWVFVEHIFWIGFFVAFLALCCTRCTREMRAVALRTAELEALAEKRLRDCPSLDARPEAATA